MTTPTSASGTRKLRRRYPEARAAGAFLLPSLIGFLIFMVYPVVFTILLSFSDWSFFSGIRGIELTGLGNYRALFEDFYLGSAIRNNFLLSFMAVPITIFGALVLAVVLNEKVLFQGFIRSMVFMPYVATLVAVAIVFGALYHPEFGPINNFLRWLGIENPPRWLADVRWALPSISFIWIWKHLGYMTVIFMAGLQAIPSSYYEVARIDGANTWQKFWNITFPLVSPTTFFLAITGLMNSFKVFPEINVLTEGGPGTATYVMVYHIYVQGFEFYKMGYASTLSLVFFVITMTITAIQWISQKKWVRYV